MAQRRRFDEHPFLGTAGGPDLRVRVLAERSRSVLHEVPDKTKTPAHPAFLLVWTSFCNGSPVLAAQLEIAPGPTLAILPTFPRRADAVHSCP